MNFCKDNHALGYIADEVLRLFDESRITHREAFVLLKACECGADWDSSDVVPLSGYRCGCCLKRSVQGELLRSLSTVFLSSFGYQRIPAEVQEKVVGYLVCEDCCQKLLDDYLDGDELAISSGVSEAAFQRLLFEELGIPEDFSFKPEDEPEGSVSDDFVSDLSVEPCGCNGEKSSLSEFDAEIVLSAGEMVNVRYVKSSNTLVEKNGSRKWIAYGDPIEGWWIEVDSDFERLPGNWEYDSDEGIVICQFFSSGDAELAKRKRERGATLAER